MGISLTILQKYKGKWIALDDKLKRVLSSGLTAKSAMKKAQVAGYEEPVLFKVPLSPGAGYVGTQV